MPYLFKIKCVATGEIFQPTFIKFRDFLIRLVFFWEPGLSPRHIHCGRALVLYYIRDFDWY